MIYSHVHTRRLKLLAVSMMAMAAASPQALAQTRQAQPAAEISGDVALSMLDIMVKRGLLTQAEADGIVNEAKAKALARAQAQASAPEAPAKDGAVHVQYVPRIVRDQIKDEVRQEVMAQAKDEGWAAPNQMPEWMQRIHISGDVRFRSEEDMFPKGNTLNTDDQANFNTLNTQSTPVDLASTTSLSHVPYYNWNKDRERERLRARLDVGVDIGDGLSTEVRLATGESSSPVSENQTLGGSGGNFSKYGLWLDRGNIRYDAFNMENYGLSAVAGRFANPFFSTDLVWNNDLNFDGVAVSGRYQVAEGVTPFVTVGTFPVYDTALNFSTNQDSQYQGGASRDKWLYAAQAGTDWKVSRDTGIKVGAAYYYFQNVEGRTVTCSADDTSCGQNYAPSFAQKGNTYFKLRNNYNYDSSSSTLNHEYQYFGLATPFHELALTGKADYDGLKPLGAKPFRVTLDGDFVKNLAFNKNSILTRDPWNNVVNSTFTGGDTGAMLRLTVGSPALKERWDWTVSLAYKYLESDAVVDAFTDSDFGMGGTNLRGYILGGNLALSKNLWTSLRWLSADSIAGAAYSSDVVFLDINAKF
ncbi:putative porin [Telmatospirillum siberiense]|uniref:Outer membrane receptor for ferric coprogen and ferric-rhodotorulic acid n=1 Tax=Telmatospirillum siberiense TaxID=382514 RepID=A0A2N3PWX5_9PROT|nr:putative porin [Telmatospirillum siberiense]PKU24897.1 hypothetical protein CWS72_08430 [Telmatospirillum siberiense]